MLHHRGIATTLTVAAGLLAGCAEGDERSGQRRADSVGDSTPAGAVVGGPAVTGTPQAPENADCPETGAWRACSVEHRLERAGFVAVRQDTTVRYPFLDVPGIAYRLGGEELHVFLYPGAVERERDLADVDPASVSRSGDDVSWSATPTLIVSGNLAAILIGGSSRRVERVQLALTAGLPQP